MRHLILLDNWLHSQGKEFLSLANERLAAMVRLDNFTHIRTSVLTQNERALEGLRCWANDFDGRVLITASGSEDGPRKRWTFSEMGPAVVPPINWGTFVVHWLRSTTQRQPA